MTQTTVAISLGEPSGIGPDILLLSAQQTRTLPWLVFGSAQALLERAALLAIPLQLEPYQANQEPTKQAGCLTIIDYPCPVPVQAGQLQAQNSVAVLRALEAAGRFCLAQKGRVLVTLPIHKGIINQAGIVFSGHTEYLAELSQCPKVVMMLASHSLKVALQTTHIPLSQVPAHITTHELIHTLTIVQHHWQRFEHKIPKIRILGLNPHAGEGGYLGHEEIEIIKPTIDHLNSTGYNLQGPVAADTAFTPESLIGIDVVLAMYHDQGLAPLKALAFGDIVNYTLGLPFIRTSVDHGVALDKAGTGQVNVNSFLAAISAANQLGTADLSL